MVKELFYRIRERDCLPSGLEAWSSTETLSAVVGKLEC